MTGPVMDRTEFLAALQFLRMSDFSGDMHIYEAFVQKELLYLLSNA